MRFYQVFFRSRCVGYTFAASERSAVLTMASRVKMPVQFSGDWHVIESGG